MTERRIAMLTQAEEAHRAGRLDAAETGYREVLKVAPHDPDALHFFGLLQFQRDQYDAGIELVRQSLQYAAENPHAWNNLGNMLVVRDELPLAIDAYNN